MKPGGRWRTTGCFRGIVCVALLLGFTTFVAANPAPTPAPTPVPQDGGDQDRDTVFSMPGPVTSATLGTGQRVVFPGYEYWMEQNEMKQGKCNVGVCGAGEDCIAFLGEGKFNAICCPLGEFGDFDTKNRICAMQTECRGFDGTMPEEVVFSRTLFCGPQAPHCNTRSVINGFDLDILPMTFCAPTSGPVQTITNSVIPTSPNFLRDFATTLLRSISFNDNPTASLAPTVSVGSDDDDDDDDKSPIGDKRLLEALSALLLLVAVIVIWWYFARRKVLRNRPAEEQLDDRIHHEHGPNGGTVIIGLIPPHTPLASRPEYAYNPHSPNRVFPGTTLVPVEHRDREREEGLPLYTPPAPNSPLAATHGGGAVTTATASTTDTTATSNSACNTGNPTYLPDRNTVQTGDYNTSPPPIIPGEAPPPYQPCPRNCTCERCTGIPEAR